MYYSRVSLDQIFSCEMSYNKHFYSVTFGFIKTIEDKNTNAYPNNRIEIRHRDLFSTLHSCCHLLLVLLGQKRQHLTNDGWHSLDNFSLQKKWKMWNDHWLTEHQKPNATFWYLSVYNYTQQNKVETKGLYNEMQDLSLDNIIVFKCFHCWELNVTSIYAFST